MHGSPDILERRDGESFLGGHHYVVKEIKSSKRIRRKHIMQAAFYNVMLAHIQGRLPEQFYLLNADGEAAEYDHARYAREIEDVVAGVARIMEGNVPQVWYGGGIFPWSDYSDKVAIQSDDLSLISGMDRNTRQMLKEMGIGTVDALLEAGAGALKKAGVPSADAAVYTTRAGAIKSGNPVRRGPTHTIRRAETDVFLRVEEAMSGEVYMIGALTRCGDTRRHNTFVSAGPRRRGTHTGRIFGGGRESGPVRYILLGIRRGGHLAAGQEAPGWYGAGHAHDGPATAGLIIGGVSHVQGQAEAGGRVDGL